MTARIRTVVFGLLAAGFAVTAAGCGGASGPKTYSVSGKVTFDGTPIPEGRILFRNLGGDRKSYSTEIKDGEYKLDAEAGEMAVEITASRIIPGKFDTSNPGEKNPVGEMYIPKQYNAATTLKATVEPKSNTQPFELSSGKK